MMSETIFNENAVLDKAMDEILLSKLNDLLKDIKIRLDALFLENASVEKISFYSEMLVKLNIIKDGFKDKGGQTLC